MVIYVAGKLTGNTPEEWQRYIRIASSYGRKLLDMGHSPIIPHLNTSSMYNEDFKDVDYEEFMRIDFDFIKAAGNIFMIPENWQDSPGAKREHEFAIFNDINIYYSLDDVPNLRR